jgi:hypothetical protein
VPFSVSVIVHHSASRLSFSIQRSSFSTISGFLMIIIPPPQQYPRRRARSRRATAGPTPPTGLIVVAATAEQTGGGIEAAAFVTFDCTEANPLADVSGASQAKWSVRIGGMRYAGAAIEAGDFNQIYVGFGSPVAEAGADELSYSNAPSDIADVLGRQLEAFVREL